MNCHNIYDKKSPCDIICRFIGGRSVSGFIFAVLFPSPGFSVTNPYSLSISLKELQYMEKGILQNQLLNIANYCFEVSSGFYPYNMQLLH